MYTVKGYVGSEEKLRTYFAGCAFEKKPRVLFVPDEILPDHITCFEYLDSKKRPGYRNRSDCIMSIQPGSSKLAGRHSVPEIQKKQKSQIKKILLQLLNYQGALSVGYHRQYSFYRRRLFTAYIPFSACPASLSV